MPWFKGSATTGTSKKSDVPNLHSDVPHRTPRSAKYGTSNIRQYNDYTKTIGNVIEEKDHRGTASEAKERIRQLLKAGKYKELKEI